MTVRKKSSTDQSEGELFAGASSSASQSHLSAYLSPLSFWAPQYIEQSAWLDHGPFAFWLMGVLKPRVLVELGTHGGYSYFAFCQAVKALGLETQCYAVDHWKGDEHSGLYEEGIYKRVWNHNETQYAAFSCLVRTSFNEAVNHFEDGTIDLLHIDGRHFYDDVRHDFETWRPKLSDRAVVLFHDTNVRERGFGVYRLWQELSKDAAAFEFLHGHGLGVLGYGPNLPLEITAFFDEAINQGATAAIRQTYSRLGESFKADYENAQLVKKLADQEARAESLEKSLDATLENLNSVRERSEEVLLAERGKSKKLEAEAKLLGTELFVQAERDGSKLLIERAKNESLELKLEARIKAIQLLRASLSWRITVPLRSIRRVQIRLVKGTKRLVFNGARSLYRNTPLPLRVKQRVADSFFWAASPLIGKTGAYRNWQLAKRERTAQADPFENRSRWYHPHKEVARPIEIDHSAAVPFEYQPVAPNAPKLAVFVHMYYESMALEFQRYLKHIPFPLDLYISTDTENKKLLIEGNFKDWTKGQVEIRLTKNRGRDVAPKLIGFKDVYEKYEYVLHVHTKGSAHDDILATWRGHLLENLVGSSDIVNSVFDIFRSHPDVGMIAAQHFEPCRHWINWGDNFKIASGLAKRMGFKLSADTVLDFPSGSMFWARAGALKPLLDLDLSFEDFPIERGQIDATPAHAIERLYYHVCEYAGFKWLKIAQPRLFEHTPAIDRITSEDELTRFITEKVIVLKGDAAPAPRTIRPPSIANPAQGLVLRLQEAALGVDRQLDSYLKIYVGIVTYNNSESQVRRILKSAQTALEHANLGSAGQILMIDNGDSTQEIATSVAAVQHLTSEGNIGFGAGHNRLMEQAFADGADIYIATNPDGAFHYDAIRALAQMMGVHDHKAVIEALQFPAEHPKVYDPFTFETAWTSGACLAIPKLVYEQVTGFDETFFMYCGDVDFSWRVRAHGFLLRICPRALFHHSVTNRRRSPNLIKMMYTSGIKLSRKWQGKAFERWLLAEMEATSIPVPQDHPQAVPEEWRDIPDFDHRFSFSPVRW